MGVHHAWGRTYKDLFQRYKAMQGYAQRYQNGFDCQGLWVEVEVEKELGFNSKRDIEAFGIAASSRPARSACGASPRMQTEQSIRLGYWMDWDNSYFTMSDENNYTIWHFLKKCHERGRIYKGHDVMPWCPRCGTGISQHEIVTEGYQELTHTAVTLRLPLLDRPGKSLLVWTTTPWTLAANVAAAVHPDLTYVKVRQGEDILYLAKGALPGALSGEYEVLGGAARERAGRLALRRPVRRAAGGRQQGAPAAHRVDPGRRSASTKARASCTSPPAAARRTSRWGRSYGLPVIAPLDEFGVYLDGLRLPERPVRGGGGPGGDRQAPARRADCSTAAAALHPPLPRLLALRHRARLPAGRRVVHLHGRPAHGGGSERTAGDDLPPLREQIMEAARKVRWLPACGLERELDWLRNMDDWMISKKRYWGLALPI